MSRDRFVPTSRGRRDEDGNRVPGDGRLAATWEPELLEGVVAIRGALADGKPLLAVPNYARNNRGGRLIVWIRER